MMRVTTALVHNCMKSRTCATPGRYMEVISRRELLRDDNGLLADRRASGVFRKSTPSPGD